MSFPIYSNLSAQAGASAQATPDPLSASARTGYNQLMGLVNQQFTSAYNNYKAQQTQASLQHQQLMAGLAQQKREWMINGRQMTFDEFLDELCPDPDDPQRTFLILKYKGVK